MADFIPVKAIFTGSDTTALGEFNPGDTVPVAHLPSISTQGGVDTATYNGHLAASNPHSVTTAQINAVDQSEKGVANGVASLDAGGKIPVVQIPAAAIPSMNVVTDSAARLLLTVQEGDEAKQLDDGSHWIYDGTTWHMYPQGGGVNIYGSEFQKAENSAVQQTMSDTDTNYLTALSFNTTTLPAGLYRITWSYGWNHNHGSSDFEAQFRVDGSTVINNHRQEPKSSSGNFAGTYSDQQHYIFREAFLTLVGSHTIDLRYRTTSPEDSYRSALWDVIITVMRVT